MDKHNYLRIDDFISPKFKDNGYGHEPCFLCGRKVNNETSQNIHLLTDGTIVDSDECFGDKDQGFFPVGPECSRKIPTNFLF
jgi:hypothetical protein